MRLMKTYLAVLTLLVVLGSGVWALGIINEWGFASQPDGTIFEVHHLRDKTFADGYVIVYGIDSWWYYAELDARGEYEASPYRVGIDDPAEIGIPKNLQRQLSAIRQAERDVGLIRSFGTGLLLTQPDGTAFMAYRDRPLHRDQPLPIGWDKVAEVPADGYVIAIYLDYEEDSGVSVCMNCDTIPIDVRIGDPASDGFYYVINYDDGDPIYPFYAFVYDAESGWYYYAVLDAQGEYVASPYKVGLDLPPGYAPATAVQERSWGAVKLLFHK